MPGREAIVILLLLFCGLLLAGCVSDTPRPAGAAAPSEGAHATTTVSPGENQTYAHARSLVPLAIPGFVLESRGKEPMTIWEDPYHFRSFWTPNATSELKGSVQSLSVDVFVYDQRDDALTWLQAFEADSDGSLTIQGIETAYRFRNGVTEIAFMSDDVIVLSSSIAERGSVPAERAVREAAVTGAEMLIRNLP